MSILDRLRVRLTPAAWGRREALELILAGLVSEGHVLVEDVPGVGKTSLIRALSEALGLEHRRLQFTPDLLPSDVTGFTYYDASSQSFVLHRGPVFTNILLADEINRTSPKTQSSLLEAMEERQVSIDGEMHRLPTPFLVVATQNPIEYEGTFPLPEAQLDRFLLRVKLGYPDPRDEREVLSREATHQRVEPLPQIISSEELRTASESAARLPLGEPVAAYVMRVVEATRTSRMLDLGVSPRGAIAWTRAARSLAFLQDDGYVTPDHLRQLAVPVLAHRIVIRPEHALGGTRPEDVINEIIRNVALPSQPKVQ